MPKSKINKVKIKNIECIIQKIKHKRINIEGNERKIKKNTCMNKWMIVKMNLEKTQKSKPN